MLVLSRHRNEEIVIGEGDNQVSVMVVDIRGDKVRLGITAPKSIAVHRREVYDAIQKNGKDRTPMSSTTGLRDSWTSDLARAVALVRQHAPTLDVRQTTPLDVLIGGYCVGIGEGPAWYVSDYLDPTTVLHEMAEPGEAVRHAAMLALGELLEDAMAGKGAGVAAHAASG